MKLIQNILLIIASVLILLPSVVSFSHIFNEHDHKLCDNYAEHHYHSKALDCDLHKFHKNPAINYQLPEFVLVVTEVAKEQIYDYYKFLNEYEPLYFDLRGPPSLA